MLPQQLSRAWQKGGWIRRLSGLTCSPSMADAGVASWIASLRASRVSPGPPPARAKASKTSGGSGPTSAIAFAKYDPGSCGWRTCLPLFPEADWPSFSGIWPGSGSMRSGACFAQPTWEPPISANGSSFWPTATDGDSRASGRHTTTTGVMHPGTSLTDAMRQWPTPNVPNGGRKLSDDTSNTGVTADGKKRQFGLENAVERFHLWATPTAMDSEQAGGKVATGTTRGASLHRQMDAWATPRAEDGESAGMRHGRGVADTLIAQTRILSHSFLPGLQTPMPGDSSSASDPTSRPLWPTAMTNNRTSDKAKYQRPTSGSQRGGASFGLEDVANLWKAPHGTTNMGEDWSTPRANCNVTSSKAMTPFSEGGSTSKPGLAQQAAGSATTKGKPKLNPQFVEWLMGLPIGWTNASSTASTASARAAMASWRFRQRSRLRSLLRERG